MLRWFSLLLLMVGVAPMLAQSRRPFTFEDMMKLKRVGEPDQWMLACPPQAALVSGFFNSSGTYRQRTICG